MARVEVKVNREDHRIHIVYGEKDYADIFIYEYEHDNGGCVDVFPLLYGEHTIRAIRLQGDGTIGFGNQGMPIRSVGMGVEFRPLGNTSVDTKPILEKSLAFYLTEYASAHPDLAKEVLTFLEWLGLD